MTDLESERDDIEGAKVSLGEAIGWLNVGGVVHARERINEALSQLEGVPAGSPIVIGQEPKDNSLPPCCDCGIDESSCPLERLTCGPDDRPPAQGPTKAKVMLPSNPPQYPAEDLSQCHHPCVFCGLPLTVCKCKKPPAEDVGCALSDAMGAFECGRCGKKYDAENSGEARCPECGHPFEVE